jgi:ribosomal protein L37AE/L43A
MITVNIAILIEIFFFIIVAFAFAGFILGRQTKSIEIKDKKLFTCPVCAYCYIIKKKDKIHKCPQCNSFNE